MHTKITTCAGRQFHRFGEDGLNSIVLICGSCAFLWPSKAGFGQSPNARTIRQASWQQLSFTNAKSVPPSKDPRLSRPDSIVLFLALCGTERLRLGRGEQAG